MTNTEKLTKGILMAGGSGTRLYPLTRGVNKHLLQVYDKPLVYYPLTTLMLAGVSDVLVIAGPDDLAPLRALMGDGSQWGITVDYAVQEKPNGIADGILVAAEFIKDEPFALILGDNVFFGSRFSDYLLEAAAQAHRGAVVFTYAVADPRGYGVLELDREGTPIALAEKPQNPRSNRAVTGLYFYDRQALEFVGSMHPSQRNELEITDLNRAYLERGELHHIELGRGLVWFDAGTTHNLLLASQLVELIQERQLTGIAFPEEVAYRRDLISFDAFRRLVSEMPQCAYRNYLEIVRSEVEAARQKRVPEPVHAPNSNGGRSSSRQALV